MLTRLLQAIALTALCSCQVYKNDFDCPPCRGVPCTSVSDIQNMIVETPDGGPDLFVEKPLKPSCKSKRSGEKDYRKKGSYEKRIWVEQSNYNGACVQSHYIYFEGEGTSEEICCD